MKDVFFVTSFVVEKLEFNKYNGGYLSLLAESGEDVKGGFYLSREDFGKDYTSEFAHAENEFVKFMYLYAENKRTKRNKVTWNTRGNKVMIMIEDEAVLVVKKSEKGIRVMLDEKYGGC